VVEGAGRLQLLRLLHIASPALPIGAFHFSQGMEHAVEAGWITDETSAAEWIRTLAEGTFERLDLPLLARLCWLGCATLGQAAT
jgi:urease accessory protein